MDLMQAFILAVVQGITEFLPVSSSAHLILFPVLMGWPDQGLTFDIAVHLGTLMAVIAYFWRDIRQCIVGWFGSLRGTKSDGGRLAWNIIIATMPIIVAGLFFGDAVEANLRGPVVIAIATIVFGILLLVADYFGKRRLDINHVTWITALVIGCFQALAMIPGTSRSGITMTAALFMGLTREASARFSFLLAVPTIAIAGLWKAKDLLNGGVDVDLMALAVGVVVSAISAFVCIHFFLKAIERLGSVPFVVYRLLLGAYLLMVFV